MQAFHEIPGLGASRLPRSISPGKIIALHDARAE
jgi:hypothetical protein